MGSFVHLHVHTEYSLLDGAARIKKLVKTCKEYKMPAVAITDHGNMYGAVSFFDACKDEGIKPIIGCEFYVAEDLRLKTGKSKYSHLVLLAKNKEGYKNLCLLNSISFKEGFYYKPRIDHKTLEKHSEGLICLSACVAGDIPQLILQRKFDEAENLVCWFKKVFKDDFYLELQNHFLEEQIEVNAKLREYSKKYDIKTVATNDVHYVYKEDAEMQDVLMCVQMGKTVDDPNRLKFPNDEFYLKTYEEMAKLFPNDIDALDTSVEIANKCNFKFEYGKYLFPKFNTPDGSEPHEFFRKIIMEGLNRRYKEVSTEILERFEREYNVIYKQGFVEYFLIVWDYIREAREMGISVGPGRGSGAGSIIAYAIGITDIDPIKYNLIFERFLHSERVSAPDFDIDFQDNRREEVIDYVKKKYTEDRVVKIVTFGTMAAKNAIKDVGRVLRVPYSEMDKVTKAMPSNIKKPFVIAKCFGLHKPKKGDTDYGVEYGVPELIEYYNSSESIKRVVDIAIKLEDCPRQCSTHACGVVIGADKLEYHMPLSRNGEDITTQYNMTQIEHLGHLKMDFLGLRNLSDIQQCKELVKENYGVEIDFDNCDYDDENIYKLISTGNTKGIFQIESSGFQKFMKELQPNCLEDIIAAVSLYRPGPMDSIPRYIHNKHNPQDTTYDHPILEHILNVTYGCIVYQEQVMQIVQELAGYTLGQADMVRRMMGKKKLSEMQKEKSVFLYGKPAEDGKPAIDGAIKRGVSEEVANKIWGEMESFASYAFNKSHAAAYSFITYQTAYLKTYYKPEFLTSVLNNRITNSDEIKNYVTYIKEEKIEVLPPDINKSKTYFSVKEGKIRFGLAALKNVGVNVVNLIIKEREENGDFVSLYDFVNRMDNTVLNKRCIESMILSGAFDCFKLKRSQLMRIYHAVIDMVCADRKRLASGQVGFFDDILKEDSVNEVPVPNIPEFDEQTKLKLEKEVVGVYVSGHPLEKFVDAFGEFNFSCAMLTEGESLDTDSEEEIQHESLEDGMLINCGGIISEVKKFFTKVGNREMGVAKMEDLYGSIDLMFFPNQYAKYKEILKEDAIVKIKGKLGIRSGEAPIILIEDFEPIVLDNISQKEEQEEKKLYLKFDLMDKDLYNEVISVLLAYSGSSPVILRCSAQNQTYKLNMKVDLDSFILQELSAYIEEDCMVIK